MTLRRKRIMIIAASAAISLLVCEGLLRLFWPQPTGPVQFAFDPVRGAIPTPNQKGRRVLPGTYDFSFSNNSLGLRGPEIGPKTRKRILLLGDSFTYGIGVNDDETFANRLEVITGAEVINAGNPGKGTDYALRFYETKGKSLNVDLVVLCFFLNDYNDNEAETYYDSDLNPRDLSKSPAARKSFLNNALYNWLLNHSQMVNLIKVNLVRLDASKAGKSIAEDHIDSSKTKRYLDALEDRVFESKAGFLVIYIPGDRDVVAYRTGTVSTFERALQSIHSAISLTAPLANSPYEVNELYFPLEGHWTSRGHELAARFLAPAVERMLAGR